MPLHPSVLFVCLHGSAKSLIAAEHFRRLAAERGYAVNVACAGLEPDPDIPPHVVAGLLRDGIDVGGQRPRGATDDSICGADVVVALGCDLEARQGHRPGRLPVVRWDGVPAVSDGYDVARDEILRRLLPLMDELLSGLGPVG
jgi:protein-tyrosine-phosphatase